MAYSHPTSSSDAYTTRQRNESWSDSTSDGDALYLLGNPRPAAHHSGQASTLDGGPLQPPPDTDVTGHNHQDRRLVSTTTNDTTTPTRHRRRRQKGHSLEVRRRYSRDRNRRRKHRVLIPLQETTTPQPYLENQTLESQIQTISITATSVHSKHPLPPAVPDDDVIGSSTFPVPVPTTVPVQDPVSVPMEGQGWYCNGFYFPELYDVGDMDDL